MLYHRTLPHLSVRQCLCLLACALLLPFAAFGQDKPTQNQVPDPLAPIFVWTRVFQISAKKGSNQELSDQVFRLKTAGLNDEDKWHAAFLKTYPGLTPALLQTSYMRVFRTSKPGIITFGQQGGRTLQMQIFAAQSPGDGTIPGTSLICEVGMHSVNSSTPLTLVMQSLEVETGMTYYFAAPHLNLAPQDYTEFIRKGTPATAFATDDHFLVFAFSIELNRQTSTARFFNEQESTALLTAAKKKVQPELNASLKQAGLSGRVQVRVEIASDGKVVKAITHNSTLPEMNSAAVAAARQWEFAPTLFAESKEPISGLLTFEFAAEAKPAGPKQQSSH